MYINLLTDDYIATDAVVHKDSGGITYYENGSWKFLEKGQYEEYKDSPSSASDIHIATVQTPMDDVIAASQAAKTENYRYYTNYFGLNNFVTANKKFRKTSGAVSEEIPVKAGKDIRLHVNIQCDPSAASVEFSLLDGNRELPIVPMEMKSIQHEKVFFMQPKRFRGKDEVYYRDNVELGSTFDESAFSDDASYTVSYTPSDDSYAVQSKNESVRIKVVLRVYNEDGKMPEVSNVRLEQEAEK